MGETGEESMMKHMCKICNKIFSCGKSLGGHMRSHVINPNDQFHQHQVKNKGCLSDLDKLCKVCGKGFQSWKALFGHMKCHSTKLSNNKSKNLASLNQDSWTSHSDNEYSESENRLLKRSRSRKSGKKRYLSGCAKTAIATTSSSMCMNVNHNQINGNNASTSMVFETEQEQEAEVAISLMMLSRDLGEWENGFESSDYYCNSSVLVNLKKVEGKDLIEKKSKMKRFKETKASFDCLEKSELGMSKIREFGSNFGEFSRIQNKTKIEHNPMLDHDQKINGFDSKLHNDHKEPSTFNLEVGSLKKKVVVLRSHECSICFKIFTSGQALGGHKRSHLIGEAKLNQEIKINEIKKPDESVHETRGFLEPTRGFLDLNMVPDAEEEEEMNLSFGTTEYKSYCWEDSSDHHRPESRMLCWF